MSNPCNDCSRDENCPPCPNEAESCWHCSAWREDGCEVWCHIRPFEEEEARVQELVQEAIHMNRRPYTVEDESYKGRRGVNVFRFEVCRISGNGTGRWQVAIYRSREAAEAVADFLNQYAEKEWG